MKRSQFENKDEYRTLYVRNNATNVNEDKPQDRTKQKNSPKERGPKRKVGCPTPRERDQLGKKKRLPFREFKQDTHSNLLGCTNFKKYLPGEPNGSDSLPKEICRLCLGTVFNNCGHNSLVSYPKY